MNYNYASTDQTSSRAQIRLRVHIQREISAKTLLSSSHHLPAHPRSLLDLHIMEEPEVHVPFTNGSSHRASHEESDSDFDYDSSDSLISMDTIEIESQFVIRHGRVYHAPTVSRLGMYPLPADEVERQVGTCFFWLKGSSMLTSS